MYTTRPAKHGIQPKYTLWAGASRAMTIRGGPYVLLCGWGLRGTAGMRFSADVAFRILSVIQVRTTLGCRPLSICRTIVARLRCSDERSSGTLEEALVLALPGRRAGGECHLLQRGAVPPGARATPDLPDRLGIGRGFLDLPGVLRVGAADSLTAAPRCRIRMAVSFMRKAFVLAVIPREMFFTLCLMITRR